MGEQPSRSLRKAGGCLLLLSIGVWLAAGQSAYTVLKNWNPTKMDCADFFRERPNKEWLHLENCSLNLLEVSYRKIPTSASSFTVDEVYIPVRPPGSTADEPIYVLLSPRSPTHNSIVKDLIELGDEADALVYAAENFDRLLVTEDVEGLVRFGMELDSRDVDGLRARLGNLDEDFIILDAGKEPEARYALYMLVCGLVIGALAVFLAARA